MNLRLDPIFGGRMSKGSNQAEDEVDELLDKLEEAVEASRGDDSSEHSVVDGEVEHANSNGQIDVRGARDVGRAIAEELVGSPLDTIVEVEHDDEEGWRVVAEVIERSSIPDTQDILGRYIIRLDATGSVRGYSRAGRYRRTSFDHQREAILADEH